MVDYKKDIQIDDTALDLEWEDQPELAIKYGEYWSQCQEEFTKAEELVKLVRSELTLKVHKNPTKTLGEGMKVTDKTVEAYYRTHKKHIKAKEKWVEAMSKMNNADIVKKEISYTRKAALQGLTDLYQANYFAGPSTPRNLKKERKKREESRLENNKKTKINKKS